MGKPITDGAHLCGVATLRENPFEASRIAGTTSRMPSGPMARGDEKGRQKHGQDDRTPFNEAVSRARKAMQGARFAVQVIRDDLDAASRDFPASPRWKDEGDMAHGC